MLNGMEYDDIELCEEEQGRVQEHEISTERRGGFMLHHRQKLMESKPRYSNTVQQRRTPASLF